MKRKSLKLGNVTVIDKDGKEEAFDPQKHTWTIANCAAAVKTMETGQVWKVKEGA